MRTLLAVIMQEFDPPDSVNAVLTQKELIERRDEEQKLKFKNKERQNMSWFWKVWESGEC